MTTWRGNKGLVIGHIGGSNCLGTGTGATTLVKPGNVTYWRLGVNTSAWANPHNAMAAMADELVNALGISAPITIVERGVSSTDLPTWISTHGPAFLADCATAGVLPNVIIHDWGAGDAQDGIHLNAADDNQDSLYDLFARSLGGGVGFLFPLLTVLPTVAPYTLAGGIPSGFSYGIWDEQREYSNRRPGRFLYLDTRLSPYNDTSHGNNDGIHRDGPAQDAVGRQYARLLYNVGALV